MDETIEELKRQLKIEQAKSSSLQTKFNNLGLRGKEKLYYSLNKNMSDIADMLDDIDFQNINIGDKDNKSMERIKMLWTSVKPLAETLNILETTAKITGNEKEDTAPRNVLEFAESRK